VLGPRRAAWALRSLPSTCAAEHATAIVVARKGKLDLALPIALGPSTQVTLLVAPILVFAGVVTLGLATIITVIITLNGEYHWFEGVQLLAVYGMVAVGAFFLV
jgi:Ca2+:H+ antiporter